MTSVILKNLRIGWKNLQVLDLEDAYDSVGTHRLPRDDFIKHSISKEIIILIPSI